MHYSRRRLLRRGLEFHVCTVNKSAHTKKVWKLIACTPYIYIYIYIVSFFFFDTQTKFLQLSNYCNSGNCALTFSTTNIFSWLRWVMGQLELKKEYVTLHIYLCGFQFPHKVKQSERCQRTDYHENKRHCWHLWGFELLRSHNISLAKLFAPKYWKNIWRTLIYINIYYKDLTL